MPQTTNYWGWITGGSTVRVEYNTTGGSAFTDASGELISWTWNSGARKAGQTNTIDGDMPLIAAGKLDAQEVTLRGVYTGASSGFWQDAQVAYQNGTLIYLRYYPAGSVAGRYRWGSGTNASSGSAAGGGCIVTQRPVPNLDSTSGDVFTYEVTIMAPGFTGASL